MTNKRDMETVSTTQRDSMDPTVQRNLVHFHIATLEAEAAAERLALASRAGDSKTSVRTALGHRLIALGTAIAATAVDEPSPDTGAARGA
jgi:hypothetical protein